MIRKTLLALTAIAALGVSVSAPTTADAKGFFKKKWHHHHGHHGWGKWGPAFGAAAFIAGTAIAVESCYRTRWINTEDGPAKVRVYVC